MANCPKCNHKLSPLDWQQNCPHCGVNLLFFGFEERFYEDAKYAEMGWAKIRVKWVRIKAALIGGKIQIARLCFSLLPLLVLVIPLGGAELATKQFTKSITFGLYGLYTAFTDGLITLLPSLTSSAAVGDIASSLITALLGMAACAACAVFVLLFSALCFFGAKVMARLVCCACVLGVGCCAATVFLENKFLSDVGGLVFTSSTSSLGIITLLAAAAAFVIVFALNFAIARKGIPVEYKEGDLFRVEMSKKLKKGEITLADIPQPVYETNDEKVAREKAIQEILQEQMTQEKDSKTSEEVTDRE